MASLHAATITGERTILTETDVQRLQTNLRGSLLHACDPRYNDARTVWNGMVDHRPALIARCAGVADVIQSVRFARHHDLLISVRCGGHSIAGKSVCQGGLMIDLSPMQSVRVDPRKRLAHVEGGATLGVLDHETQAFGLATTAGVVTHTGVAGLTLGGGVGRLARKYGLACDNLLGVDLVNAEGCLVRASATENADLFWGVRGGGGNFGIATAFDFQLHPVGPIVLGGKVIYPFEQAQKALQFYGDYTLAAPDELSIDAILLTSPEGRRVLAFSICYIGPHDAGERVLEPLRRYGAPLADTVAPAPYTVIQADSDRAFPPGQNYYWKTHFLQRIHEDAIAPLVAHFAQAPSPRAMMTFQQYGGAIGRVEASATAFGHREAQYDFLPIAIWNGAADAAPHIEWSRQAWEIMQPFATGGEYVNNLGEDDDERIRAAFGANYERLASLKTKYDPTNFFRLNANIQPAAAANSEPMRTGNGGVRVE